MALNIDNICLPFEKLYRVLEEMSSILTFAFGSEEFENYKSMNSIPLKDVALLLMKKVIIYFCFQIICYLSTNVCIMFSLLALEKHQWFVLL